MAHKQITKKSGIFGFTLVELLVVLSIIALLLSISLVSYNNIRQKARDIKRVKDVEQIQAALKLYFYNEGVYPQVLSSGQAIIGSSSSSTYMAIVPLAPNPADGECTTDQNTISYSSNYENASYSLSFCLGSAVKSISAGPKCLTPSGILNEACTPIGDIFSCADAKIVKYDGGQYDYNGFSTTTGGYYRTTQIGDQCWLRDNLNIGAQLCSVGTTCLTEPNDSFSVTSTEKYCYENNLNYCLEYGALYTWTETIGLPNKCKGATYDCTTNPAVCDSSDNDCDFSPTLTRGICPSGWHIPNNADLTTLSTYLSSNQGNKLKEVGTAHWEAPNTGATNSSGFTALGSGYHNLTGGSFNGLKNETYLFSRSVTDNSASTFSGAILSDSSFYTGTGPRSYGFSVRCIKN